MEVIVEEHEENEEQLASSQDFPFIQSQTQDTLMLCNICRYTTRDKLELREHMSTHFQCEVCGQYYSTKQELDHHSQNHMKVTCQECNAKVRKDELNSHKLNHVQLNSFGKKMRKPRTVKPVTGYGLWQRQERKKIVESNPDLISTEVSSELGRRWRLVDNVSKANWKREATDFNNTLKSTTGQVQEDTGIDVPVMENEINDPRDAANVVMEDAIVDSVDATLGVQDDLENIPSCSNHNHMANDDLSNMSISSTDSVSPAEPANKKRRIVEHSDTCPLCEFTADSSKQVVLHMKQKHRFTQPTIVSCEECKMIFCSIKSLQNHKEAQHGVDQVDVEGVPMENEILVEVAEPVEMEIVLVKKKKLGWPAIVLRRENENIEVKMIYDDAIKTLKANDIEPFDIRKIGNTKNSRLKQAFAKAAKLSNK